MRPLAHSLVLATCGLAGLTSAQSGTYTKFGSGCPGTGGPAGGVVVPASFATQFGNSQNIFGVGQANTHYQQVFLASEIGGARVFLGYALRENDTSINNAPGGVVSYTILLGYTTFGPTTLTSTYANNYNTSRGLPTRVFQGNVNLPSLPGPNTDLAKFAFEVKFPAPWVFASVSGENLLYEQQATHTTSVAQYLDAGSPVNTARVYNTSSSTAPTGTVAPSYGLAFKWLSTQGGRATPQIGNVGLPDIGKVFQVTLAQARANTAAALILGVSNTSWGAIKLPLDLTAAGAAGCSLLVSPDVMFGFPVNASGNASAPLAIPNDTSLRGVIFHNQWAVADAGANTLGWAFSDGGTAKIGG
jgi:hypothetical protein